MPLTLRVLCVNPPAPEPHGAQLGLQKKNRDGREILPGEARPEGDRVFTCQCEVHLKPGSERPDFRGDCIYGKPGDRFLYLVWLPAETPEGITGPYGHRRMKIPLTSVTWEQVEQAQRTGRPLEVTVSGRARDGGIPGGTVPLLPPGWTVSTS